MPEYVILGEDVETGQPIWIGDVERCGGLYVLGKPRTGKSNLFVSLDHDRKPRPLDGEECHPR